MTDDNYNTVVLYHANCMDGMGAAWAVKLGIEKNYKSYDVTCKFIPVNYGYDIPNECVGKHIIIVDFSFKLPELMKLHDMARSVIVIDHHKTAFDDLKDLTPLSDAYLSVRQQEILAVRFDMEKSGAMLAWEYFNRDLPPYLIRNIQDRDLWKFKYEDTKAIHAEISSWPDDLDGWAFNANCLSHDDIRTAGSAILRKQNKDIKSIIASAEREELIDGHLVPVINVPPMWASDTCNILAKDKPFAAAYYDNKHGRSFSLRSEENGLDVSEIAKKFGGGGHKHASGFRINWDDLKQSHLIDWV